MSIPQYGKAIVRQIMVNNVDITQSLSTLFTSTSILTPFQMAKMTINDASKIQDALYESGVPISLVYSAGDGSNLREMQLLSMANRAGVKNENNRSGSTEFTAISESFFNMHNDHTSHHQNITASEALQKLHKELDPKSSLIVTKTKGMIGDREPYHLRGVKLGQGIDMIRQRMTDQKFGSGAFTYFKDHIGDYISKPIEQLFADAAGPTFTNIMGGTNFLRDQQRMGHNIYSFEKGGMGDEQGSDNAATYRHHLKQSGGDAGTGFNWQTMEYKKPSAKDYKPGNHHGQTEWKGPKAKNATHTNHKFNYDPNQKKQEDFEGTTANQNIKAATALQGSMTVNLPLEGGMGVTVGKGCYLDIPAEVGDQKPSSSSAGGQHLVIAQGEYIFMGDGGLIGVSALHTASGGKKA
jgi:hypothetical protein